MFCFSGTAYRDKDYSVRRSLRVASNLGSPMLIGDSYERCSAIRFRTYLQCGRVSCCYCRVGRWSSIPRYTKTVIGESAYFSPRNFSGPIKQHIE